MCGIYGSIGFGQSGSQQAIDTMVHRGPDSRGYWAGDGVVLGMRRLSIIDISGGEQPIWNEDQSICVVSNGEIYNYRQLRHILQNAGHQFRTGSDTEVLVHAYEQWGCQMVWHLNGMFAFAVWDRARKRLFVARDRAGEKPLYYYRAGDRLVFASEIKAVLETAGVPREMNLRGLANFVAFGHAIAPDTIYQGISKLLPGHYLVVEGGRVTTSEYWDVGMEAPDRNRQNAKCDWPQQVRELLEDSVRMRMVADVPVGAFLSGGVDSSAVVSLMRKHTAGRVKTFALGFTVGGAYNELQDARRVAEQLDTEHHELHVQDLDLVKTLETLVYHYDEPFSDAANFPLYLLSKFAAQHVKVVLTGDGGDELFGGYRRYAVDRMAGLYQKLPGAITGRLIPAAAKRVWRMRRVKRVVETLPIRDPARRYSHWLLLFSPAMQEQLLKPEIAREIVGYDPAWPYPRYYGALNANTAADHLNRLMYIDLKTWLADTYLEKADKATMAASLEGRMPLLDHRLIELAFQIPGTTKLRGGSLKWILKEAVRGIVPACVLTKPKHGFAVPTDPWFRGSLKEFAFSVLMDPSSRGRGYFNMDYVERLWREHSSGQQVWDGQLWALLNFELWHRRFMDGRIS